MKKLFLFILTLFLCVNIYSQKQLLYVTHVTNIDLVDTSYNSNSVSGVMLSFDIFIVEDSIYIIRLGYIQDFGTTYSDYKVRNAKKVDGIIVLLAENMFGHEIAYRREGDEFFIYHTFDHLLQKWHVEVKGHILNTDYDRED